MERAKRKRRKMRGEDVPVKVKPTLSTRAVKQNIKVEQASVRGGETIGETFGPNNIRSRN